MAPRNIVVAVIIARLGKRTQPPPAALPEVRPPRTLLTLRRPRSRRRIRRRRYRRRCCTCSGRPAGSPR